MSTESPRSAVVNLVRMALRLDRTQSDPVVSFRNAVGVVLPLAIGAINGNAALGLAAAIGALQTAFADRPGPYRLRMLRMVATALAAGITSAVAVALSRSDVASALLLLVLGFGAGLLLGAGPSAAQLGVAATGCALVLGHTPQSPADAVHAGLLVFAGGAAQAVLAIAAWPLGRHGPERRALGGLYLALAEIARRPPRTSESPPLVELLAAVRATLFGLGHDHGPSVEAYRVLLDEAERIRRDVLVLAAQADRLTREDAEVAARQVHSVLAAAGEVLAAIGVALPLGQSVDEQVLGGLRARVQTAVRSLDAADAPGAELTRRAAAARVRSLTGELRAAVATTRIGASEGVQTEQPDHVTGHGVQRLRDPLRIIKANLTPDSALLRHAVRLAVLVGGTDLVVRLAGISRGYWIPLTILVILRPDFGTTLQRGLLRVAGTIVGLVLATVLVHFVPGGQWYGIVLAGVFFFGMRVAGPGNVGLSAVGLSAFVVVLLSLDGIAPHTSVYPRAWDTLIGGALALAATLLGPTWERRRVPARLAELLTDYRGYLLAVMDPATTSAALQRARAASRLARSNARASVDQARAEPVPARAEVELGEAVLVHTHRFIHAMLTMDAVRDSVLAAGEFPELAELMSQAAQALERSAQAVRTGAPPRGIGSLRPTQERVASILAADPQRVGDLHTAGAVMDATDRLTNSIDTLVSELRRQLTGQGVAATTAPD